MELEHSLHGGADGIRDCDRIGQILLPEIYSNLCFGGKNRNRLFMTASRSVYAIYMGVQDADWAKQRFGRARR
jgi:gluconolactonase